MSCSRTAEPKVKKSLEQIYNELNRLGYDLIDYTNSLSDMSETDIWNNAGHSAASNNIEPLPDIQKIIDGFKQLEGLPVDLLSPYGDIDFDFENRKTRQECAGNIIKRYNKAGGMVKETPYPSTPQELIARYQKLKRG